jgi:hypothetical protein
MNDRIISVAQMLEHGVSRLQDPERRLMDKHKTLTTMRGLCNQLATEIEKEMVDRIDSRLYNMDSTT